MWYAIFIKIDESNSKIVFVSKLNVTQAYLDTLPNYFINETTLHNKMVCNFIYFVSKIQLPINELGGYWYRNKNLRGDCYFLFKNKEDMLGLYQAIKKQCADIPELVKFTEEEEANEDAKEVEEKEATLNTVLQKDLQYSCQCS